MCLEPQWPLFFKATPPKTRPTFPSKQGFWFELDRCIYIHPGRLTWNLKIPHLERTMIFQTSMIRFHVNLPGCRFFVAAYFAAMFSCLFQLASLGRLMVASRWSLQVADSLGGRVAFLGGFCSLDFVWNLWNWWFMTSKYHWKQAFQKESSCPTTILQRLCWL